jgi:hypothetical protein
MKFTTMQLFDECLITSLDEIWFMDEIDLIIINIIVENVDKIQEKEVSLLSVAMKVVKFTVFFKSIRVLACPRLHSQINNVICSFSMC